MLSKIIDEGDPTLLARYNIDESDMPTEAERQAYRFIEDYAQSNGGQSPSYATVVAEIGGFDYIPAVSDNFEYLARQTKNHAAKLAVKKLFEHGDTGRKFRELDGDEFLDWLAEETAQIKEGARLRESVGTDAKRDTDKFLAEYERRKAGESFRLWKSKFSSIGEYISSNLYTVYGKSGRGKSIITLEDAIYAAEQGANVLIWAMEMGKYEVMTRIYVSLSGEEGVTRANIHGLDLEAGFDSGDVRTGRLSEEFEAGFRTFLSTINSIIPGNIVVRAVDDEDFSDRSLRALEADIEATEADYVVIDPFYYLHYERNTSRTTGGDAANTSMRLRAMTGRTDTVIIAITQADEDGNDTDEEGNRELTLPKRDGVKKTSQLMEDAYLLIGIDSDYKQGRAMVGVFKGRDGGEGNVTEVLFIPQVGVVREFETGEALADQFEF